MSLVWRAGLQRRHCKVSVVCWTPTAIVRVQCGVLDPNRDIGVECGVLDLRKSGQRSSCKMSQDKSNRLCADIFARKSKRMCQRERPKICQECRTMFTDMSAEVGVT